MWWLTALAVAFAGSPADEIVAAFTPRHAAPPCSEVAPGWSDDARRAAFVAVAEEIEAPPWVPLAAAACVAEGAEDPVTFEVVRRWIDDPARAGLALAAVHRLDRLPESTATHLAEAAVARGTRDARFGAWVREPLVRSAHAGVRRSAEPLER